MEHLHLILFLIMMLAALALGCAGLHDWLAAEELENGASHDERN